MLLGAVLLAPAAARAAEAPDSSPAADSARVRAWQTGALRPDRLQHASLSFALGLGAGLAADSPAAGASFALALGIAKEAADRRTGAFDFGDLAADAAGAALAAWAVSALRR